MAWGYQSAKSAGQSAQESLLLHNPTLTQVILSPSLQMDQVCGVRSCGAGDSAEQEQGAAAVRHSCRAEHIQLQPQLQNGHSPGQTASVA